jgi:signal transduction histidine kinase
MDSDAIHPRRVRSSRATGSLDVSVRSTGEGLPVVVPAGARDGTLTTARLARDAVRHPLRVLAPLVVERAATALGSAERAGEQWNRLTTILLRALWLANIPGTAPEHRAPESIATVPERSALRRALLDHVTKAEASIDGADLARVLDALEEPDEDTGMSDASQSFGDTLGSVDAVQAVVEIAHDMRSPLTSILFLVDTLRRAHSGPVTTVQERQLGLIYGATLGLSSLACDVLDALRGGQRLIDGFPVPFSVANVILDVCNTVRPISEEKGLPLEFSLPADDGRVGYPSALGRVLLNLVTNALKYTREGTVNIGCSARSATVIEFWVQDTGEGIPPAVMSMLFDGFRPSTSGIRFSNAGLGLAICQNFLRDMGSRLEVESSPASGTRFSFVLDLPRA